MLGPREIRSGPDPADGTVVEVGGARLRALLIMLALHPGRLVTSGQLIDGLWAAETPAGAANALQALVSRLRRAVPEAAIESRPTGYQLRLDPRCTDVVRFEELAAAGRAQLDADPAGAAATLRETLAARLMRALRQSGQRGAALGVYEQTRRRLVEQLGVQPSPELAALHLEILRADEVPPARLARPANREPAR